MTRRATTIFVAVLFVLWSATTAYGYSFNQIVPDIRQSTSVSGGSACPIPAHQLTASGSIAVRWSTVLGTNPVTILTNDQTPTGR